MERAVRRAILTTINSVRHRIARGEERGRSRQRFIENAERLEAPSSGPDETEFVLREMTAHLEPEETSIRYLYSARSGLAQIVVGCASA